MQLLKLTRLPLFVITTLLMLSVVATPTVSAQSCPAADADDGSSDGVITINNAGTTTWTDTDGTAFDCSTLSITVTNTSTLAIAQDQSTGYAGQINAVNLTIDAGSIIEANAQGCTDSTSPSLSTNICADGGTSEGSNGGVAGGSAGGAASSGAGGDSQVGNSGGVRIAEDDFAPQIFGAGGGSSTAGTGSAGGSGGGALRINLSGNLTNNGTISVNGGNGGTKSFSGAGGGGGGSLYITVGGNIVSTTGLYEAKGGNGGATANDGGGGGGGFIYVEYVTSSIATSSFATYTNVAGGAGNSATDGSEGSVVYRDTTNSHTYFVEGASWVDPDTSVCSSNTCSFQKLTVLGLGQMNLPGNASTGSYPTLNISSNLTLESGGVIYSSALGCGSSTSPNLSTNICADGGTSEGTDGGNGGGGAASGSGGASVIGTSGGESSLASVIEPTLFGAGGGTSTTAGTSGASGGGVIRLNISGDLSNGGSIVSNGGVSTGASFSSSGGGGGGSLYISVGGDIASSTGTYEAKGGASANFTNDGGGGGGGYISIEYATSSIATSSFATYTDVSGGTGNETGESGDIGNVVLENTTTNTHHFIEGDSKLNKDGGFCTSGICTLTNVAVENGGTLSFVNDLDTGAIVTLETTGNLTVESGGIITANSLGCNSSESANPTTNICADGGTGEGAVGGSGAAHGGVGGDASGGALGSTSTYGSSTSPSLHGSGGGVPSGGALGGGGGGVVKMIVNGTFTNSGTVNANGGNGATLSFQGGGGGSGGSIYIAADILAGASTSIFANGGAGGNSVNDGGGGGGGRICVYFETTNNSTWLGSLTAATNTAGGIGPDFATDGGNGTLDGATCQSGFNTAPTATSVTATQLTDGSGGVTIGFTIDDADDDDTLEALVEYSLDGGGSWSKATLSTTDEDTTVTLGSDPDVNNSNTYQIGDATKIESSSGANTVATEWDAATDVASSTDIANAQIRITPYDGTVAGSTSSSSNFDLDVQVPVTPTLSYVESTDSETVTISASAAEVGTSIYNGGVDTGDVVAGDGTFTLSVDLTSETNTFSITTVDDKGNVSVAVIAAIEKTSASGGTFSSSTTTSETTTEETIVEETVEEEIVVEEVVEEEIVIEETVPEETDDFAIAGDDEDLVPDSSPADGNDSSSQSEETSSIAGESQTGGEDADQDDDSGETSVAGESQIGGQVDSGGQSETFPEAVPEPIPEPLTEVQITVEENIPRILRFFENERLFGERNDYGIPLTFIGELQVDFGETYDADADGVSDYNELLFGTDPYESDEDMVHFALVPDLTDEEIDQAIDTYIEESGMTPDEIKVVDSDGDGLSDMHEILMGMDPLSADGDGDGLSDGEELLFYGTDPTSETNYDVSIVIGNFIGVSEASEGEQLITGHTYPNSLVNIFELTDAKDKRVGHALSDEDGRFSILTNYFEPGKHTLVATSKHDGFTLVSNVVILDVSEGSRLTQPDYDPEVLEFGDKVYVSEAFVGLIPVLEEVLEKNAIIMLTWESTIFGQTIIADAFNLEGTIIFRPPADLDLGKHEVSWFAINPKEGLRSTAGKIEFTIVPVTYTAVEARQNRTLWIAIVVSTALLAILLWMKRKNVKPVKPQKSSTSKTKKPKTKK